MKTIDNFRTSEFEFLANYYRSNVLFDGDVYPTVEHAFQAAKTDSKYDRQTIKNTYSSRAAKRFGRSISIRSDWDDVRVSVMKKLLESKFANSKLRELLLSTCDAELVSGGDDFWGKRDGTGDNHLGKLLMKIRSDIAKIGYDSFKDIAALHLKAAYWTENSSDECWSPPWSKDSGYTIHDAVAVYANMMEKMSLVANLEEIVNDIMTLPGGSDTKTKTEEGVPATTSEVVLIGPICNWCGGKHIGLDCSKRDYYRS